MIKFPIYNIIELSLILQYDGIINRILSLEDVEICKIIVISFLKQAMLKHVETVHM